MSELTQNDLRALQPAHDYFIGIDSDGCVFDSMELKQKECFCPAFINHFRLQGACREARETWEFVNLYSRTRGLNRFKAVVEALKLLGKRKDVLQQIAAVMDPADLDFWISKESRLSGGTLKTYLETNFETISEDSVLHSALKWTEDVATAVEQIVHDLPPIAEAVSALETLHSRADCMVVSQTPYADLVREWREHDIDRFARLIAGQEQGTKEEHLALSAAGKYDPMKILMIGDAPGDHAATKENGVLFFPIVPGRETDSWKEMHSVGLNRFFENTFAGDYQKKLLENFYHCLPEQPSWEI